MEQRTLQFDLSHLASSREYTLHACLREHRLLHHTRETLEHARGATPLLRAIPSERLTHYVTLELPSDAVALLWVTSPREDGSDAVALMAIHVPQHAYRLEQARRAAAPQAGMPAIHPKLRNLDIDVAGFRGATASEDPAPYPVHIDDYKNATEAAVAYLFHHREVMNLATTGYGAAYVIQNYLEANPSLCDLATRILMLRDDWMKSAPVLDEHGQQMRDAGGNLLWTQKVDPQVTGAARGPLGWAIRKIKDDPHLEGLQWNVQQGFTASDYGATQGHVAHAESADAGPSDRLSAVARADVDSTGFRWTMNNLSPSSGFTVDARSLEYTPPTTTAAWRGTGFWVQPADEGGQEWPYAKLLLDGQIYLKVATARSPQGLVKARLIPGPAGSDLTTSFTVDLSAIGPACIAGLTLAAMQTSLAWKLWLDGDQLRGTTVAASFCDADGNDLALAPLTDTSGYGTLTVDVTNHWLRHLAAYVQFFDDAGRVIIPDPWSEVLPDFIRGLFQPDSSKKYVELISPVETICGIPLPATATTLTIPLPANAASIRLLCGGLGTGQYDGGVCGIGITCTVVGELALPVIVLVAGAAIKDTGPLRALLADANLLFGVCAVAAFLLDGDVVTDIVAERNPRPALEKLASSLGPLLLKTGLKWFIVKMVAEGVVERALPLIDVAFQIFNAAVTAAELTETTIEVLESPFVYETRVTRAIDIEVILTPDARYHEFPRESVGGYYSVLVIYDDHVTYGAVTNPLPGTPMSDPIAVTFISCPAGGRLTVRAFFYAANGWQAGQGWTAWLPALPTDGSTLVIDGLQVTNNQVPLSASSVYLHKSKIAYEGTHRWVATSDPPATTVTTPSPYVKDGKQLVNWTGITLAQGPAQIAYSYEATGLEDNASLYTVENLSILQDPELKYAVPGPPGFAGKATAVYNLVSPDDGTGQNFWLDPSLGAYDPQHNPAGGIHLRRVVVGYEMNPPVFAPANNQSFGRFIISADRYVVHPKGYVLGISYDTSKLQILHVPPQATDDKDAPVATLASGEGSREGLMSAPVALGAASDGRILILEAINQRIQAFAVDGTPVRCFGTTGNQSSSTPLYQPGGCHFLDVAIEAKGYIYVLGYDGDPDRPASYFLDIYQPSGEWLVRTTGTTAAKILVDELRSLYTLNYEIILGAGGRPEPSISLWEPTPPRPPVRLG